MNRFFLGIFLILILNLNAQQSTYLSLELQTYLESADPQDETDLFIRGDFSVIEDFIKDSEGHLKFHSDNIVSATIKNESIYELGVLPGVNYIEFSMAPPQELNDLMLINNNIVAVHAGAPPLNQAYTGTDVIMGFVDTGLELEHPDFQDADGNSRVLYIWDQNDDEIEEDRIPEYGYGQVYDFEDIADDINVHEDNGQYGHGTTVTGTGAGNANATGQFKGVAPDANIIAVSSDFGRSNWTSSVADAVDYIYTKAQEMGMPAVVNLSLGSYYGSHDGLDAAALHIDELLDSGPGFSVVCAAGNSGSEAVGNYHLSYDIPEVDTAFTWFTYNPEFNNNEGAVFFEAWADQNDFDQTSFALGVDANGSEWEFRGYSNWRTASENLNTVIIDTIFFNGEMMGIVETWVGERGDQFEIEVKVSEVFNTQYPWRFATTGGGVFDCWTSSIFGTSSMLDSDLPNQGELPDIAKYEMPDNDKTIVDSWACSDKVITVGNYINRSSFINVLNQVTTLDVTPGEIANSSSRGPTRDGRQKPTIAATGAETLSASKISVLNDWIGSNPTKVAEGGWHIINGGTSMASPVVAGVAALYYDCNSDANYQDIIDAVIETAMADQFTGQLPGQQFGHGKVNGFAVVSDCDVLLSSTSVNREKALPFFPNPSEGVIQVTSSLSFERFEVHDISGRMISEISAFNQGGTYVLNLEDLPSGLYVIKAINSDGSYNTSKVLIEK